MAIEERHTDAARILVVDDEPSVRRSLAEWFGEEGFEVATAESGPEAVEVVQEQGGFDIYLVDLRLPGFDGIALQKRLRHLDPDGAVIILTGYGSVETAVEALRLGAFDYITKPVDPDDVVHAVRRTLRELALARENARLRRQVAELAFPAELVGDGPAMARLRSAVESVAGTEAPVLVFGEAGTEREAVARVIHSGSPRRFGPFVAVRCRGAEEAVLRRELFGSPEAEGTEEAPLGALNLAVEGTLYLEDVDALPPGLQEDLARALDETGRSGGVPGDRTYRLVASACGALQPLVAEGRFREDLYQRLDVVHMTVPPLRERGEDTLELAEHLLAREARRLGVNARRLSEGARDLIGTYPWPWNTEELEVALRRALLVGSGGEVRPEDLGLPIREGEPGGRPDLTLDAVERAHIQRVLREMKGNIARTARILGIDRGTLYHKIRRYNLER